MNMPGATLLGQAVLSGVFIGALYGLLGLGLSLAWGLLGQINLAHFALAFLGAYLTYHLATVGGMDPLLTLAIGALFVPLPELITLLIAIALSLAAWAVLRYTDVGRAVRAAAEDPPIARAFGVDARKLSYLVAGTAAALAGAAGLCLALSQTLAPAQIYAWIGVIFAVVMMGGPGRALGPIVAGIVIGVSEAVTMAVTAPSWAPVVSFSVLILLLIARPGKA